MRVTRRLMVAGLTAFAAAALPSGAYAQDAVKIRVSIDTNQQHTRSKAIQMFADEVKRRSGGKMDVELFHSAQLFNDKDVPRALRRGQIEMGAPGVWQLDAFVPEGGISMLPMFYGLPASVAQAILDGPAGQAINKRIEEKLDVKVIGPWADLGFQHTYSTSKPIKTHDDIKGMKVRIPGGTLNALRVEGLGGNSQLVPWADVPLALQQGAVDALLTTNMSAASARLWDAGVKHAFLDRQYFGQYVPMVGGDFWKKLKPEQQQVVTESWAAIIKQARADAAAGQDDGLKALRDNGVSVVEPTPDALRTVRLRLTEKQDEAVKKLGMDPKLVEQIRAEIEKHAS